jgi:hypothetical protein
VSLRRRVMSVKKGIVVVSLILTVVGLAATQDKVPPKGGVSGIVRYPDGSPSSNATVVAVTNCKDDIHISYVQEVRTSSDGSFYVPPFLASACNHIRLSAEKREDFWLKTGREVFYESDNGTTPEVDAPRTGPSVVTEIRFGKQGGLVSFRVRDVASNRFIYAELQLERTPPPETNFGSMRIATGHDGSPDTLLLPAGQYKIFLEGYSCRGKNYFTDGAPLEPLAVEAGGKLAKDFSVDARAIKPIRSYDNPKAKPCEP